MPLKSGQLTRKEEDFARVYVESGFDLAKAEKEVGYRPGSGREAAARPAVSARIDEYIEAQLAQIDLMCVEWAKGVLADPNRSDTIKLGIWKQVRTSRDARREEKPKDPAEMSLDELAQEMEKLERERAQLAKDVTQEASLFD